MGSVIEGTCRAPVGAETIAGYLRDLSDRLGMKILLDPVAHRSDRYGWAGWIHWEASGVHVYLWECPLRFSSVDIYACRSFDAAGAVRITSDASNAIEIVAKAF